MMTLLARNCIVAHVLTIRPLCKSETNLMVMVVHEWSSLRRLQKLLSSPSLSEPS